MSSALNGSALEYLLKAFSAGAVQGLWVAGIRVFGSVLKWQPALVISTKDWCERRSRGGFAQHVCMVGFPIVCAQ